MENRESCYVRILREICEEEGILLDSYSSDWAFRLRRDGRTAFILGYQFGLNSASVQQICRDKNITSEILRQEQIPSVFHSVYMSPEMQSYIGICGNWRSLLAQLEQYGRLVCKDNYGTGGHHIYVVGNERELEAAASEIFAASRAMAVCPYVEITEECRLVMLDGTIRLAFEKIRPFVEGDGVTSMGGLIGQAAAAGKGSGYTLPPAAVLRSVPERGEKVWLNWKHNLGQGAVSRELEGHELPEEAKMLAWRTREVLGFRFASVDLIRSSAGWQVLEVNSGVMMEHFASECEEHYQKAKAIYRDAVRSMLS